MPQFPHWWKSGPGAKFWESPAHGKRWRGSQRQFDAGCWSTVPGPPEGTRTGLGAAWQRSGGWDTPSHSTPLLGPLPPVIGVRKSLAKSGSPLPRSPAPRSRPLPAGSRGAAAPRTVSLPICSSVVSKQHRIYCCQHCRARTAAQRQRARFSSDPAARGAARSHREQTWSQTQPCPRPNLVGVRAVPPELGWGRVQAWLPAVWE